MQAQHHSALFVSIFLLDEKGCAMSAYHSIDVVQDLVASCKAGLVFAVQMLSLDVGNCASPLIGCVWESEKIWGWRRQCAHGWLCLV